MAAPRPGRSALHRHSALAFAVIFALGVSAAPVDAAERHRIDVGTRGDFVAQTNFVQCVGASLQMMINMIEPGRDRTAKTQLRLQQLARSNSPARPTGRERRGASVRGWVRVLRMEVDQPYRLVGADSLKAAVRLAAEAIERTDAPVGLLVWRGRHAWVMGGYESDGKMREGGRVTKAVIYDPLHPYGSKVWGPSPRPGEAITMEALGRQFVARNQSSRAGSLAGKYVLVLPYVPRGTAKRPA